MQYNLAMRFLFYINKPLMLCGFVCVGAHVVGMNTRAIVNCALLLNIEWRGLYYTHIDAQIAASGFWFRVVVVVIDLRQCWAFTCTAMTMTDDGDDWYADAKMLLYARCVGEY